MMFREVQRRGLDIVCLASKHFCCVAERGAHRSHHFYSSVGANAALPAQTASTVSRNCTIYCARMFSTTVWSATGASSTEHEKQESSKERIHVASDILQQVAARKLGQHLREESKVRLCMPVNEAILKAKELGAAQNDDEAQALLRALHTSGDLLRHENKLYLRPEEVAEIVLKALPDTQEEAQEKLREIHSELEPMRKEFNRIESQAQTQSSMVAYLGLALLCCQFALFLRLTYWELSWDVMEPVSYFSGQLIGIMMYAYFLVYKQDFTYEQACNRYKDAEKFRLIQKSNFNYEKYHRLMSDAHRWKRFSRALARR